MLLHLIVGEAKPLKYVKQMRVRSGITVGELVKEMDECGVLGAGRFGKAAELVAEMFGDPDCTVFLTLAGALVPGGLRKGSLGGKGIFY